MIDPPLPRDEDERLAELESYRVLDTEPELAFDDLTALAAQICGTPISLVSLLDETRQWFKSRKGLDACETDRRLAFCAHAILEPQSVMVVPDSHRDDRFTGNPLVSGPPHVRFYAGAPLVTCTGQAVGTLCVIDHVPRQLSEEQIGSLRALARQVVSQLELRRKCFELSEVVERQTETERALRESEARLTELNEQLERNNEDLTEFNYVAAHDLQEPLRKLVSFSELLREDLGGDIPPAAEEDLGYISDAARRMQRLITDLLALSRTGTTRLDKERISLADCAHIAVDALSLRIRESGAEVVIEALPDVRGDRTMLTQLFQNLVGNALKFIRDRTPRIRVTCRTEGDEVVFGVQDNGIGIEEQHAANIFTPFMRLHGRGEYEGSGIGLAIAKKAIERHGGRIWVESTPGVGSHFRFTVEKVFDDAEEAQPTPVG